MCQGGKCTHSEQEMIWKRFCKESKVNVPRGEVHKEGKPFNEVRLRGKGQSAGIAVCWWWWFCKRLTVTAYFFFFLRKTYNGSHLGFHWSIQPDGRPCSREEQFTRLGVRAYIIQISQLTSSEKPNQPLIERENEIPLPVVRLTI